MYVHSLSTTAANVVGFPSGQSSMLEKADGAGSQMQAPKAHKSVDIDLRLLYNVI